MKYFIIFILMLTGCSSAQLDYATRVLGQEIDEVLVLVAHNPEKSTGMFLPKDRVQLILDSVGPRLVGKSVKADYMRELVATVDVCTKVGARAMIRGLRSITDFDSH